jgi:hypothetical protein
MMKKKKKIESMDSLKMSQTIILVANDQPRDEKNNVQNNYMAPKKI